MYHEHPLKILRFSMKNIWLLIFPLLRGLSVMHFDAAGVYTWLKGAWFDILVLGLILLFGYVRWYYSYVDITEHSIIHTEGVFIRVRTAIPLNSVSVATVERPLLMIPFNGVRMSIDTRAGILKRTDMKLLVTGKVCAGIISHIPDVDDKRKTEGISRPTLASILLFSVFFSSSFSGVVYIAAFFIKGGDIAHDIITLSLSKITETTELLPSKIVQKIPAAALAAGMLFIAAWTLSFIINIIRYSRFRMKCDDRRINVSCGVINRREYRINSEHINYTDLRQNLIMKLCGVVTVNISCAGYGSESQYLPVLLPIRMEKDLGRELEKLGVFSGGKMDIVPRKAGLMNYIWLPVIATVSLFPAGDFLAGLFPKFAELIRFTAIMLEIPSIWMVAVKTVALMTSGVSLYDDRIMVRCSKWTAFHTVVADLDNIVKIDIQQSLFQLLNGRCSVHLWMCGEMSTRYIVRSITLEDAMKISKLLDYRLHEKVKCRKNKKK